MPGQLCLWQQISDLFCKSEIKLIGMHFVDLQMASVGMQTATPAQLAAGVVAGALASPCLAAAPLSYVSKAFELSRVFLHRWTVTSNSCQRSSSKGAFAVH